MFCNYRYELSVENQMVFKGNRIVVPATLQHTILRRRHEGHMGLEKMTPNQNGTTTPGSNDSGKYATQPLNGSTDIEHYITKSGHISKPTSRYYY